MEDEIKTILRELRAIRFAGQHLEEARQLRRQQHERLGTLEEELNRISTRIDRLQGRSLYTLIRDLRGSRDEQLGMQQQGYLNLALEINELHASLDKLDFEIGVLERKVSKHPEIISQLKAALRKHTPVTTDLSSLKETITRLEHQVIVQRELEEAVSEGKSLVRRFDTALRYVVQNAGKVYRMSRSTVADVNLNTRVIEKYQHHMITIQHCMVRFEAEVNDVYNSIMRYPAEHQKIAAHFLTEYRMNLVNDIQRYMDLNSSANFLKYYRSLMANLVRTLSGDLRKVKKEIRNLEEHERRLIDELGAL